MSQAFEQEGREGREDFVSDPSRSSHPSCSKLGFFGAGAIVLATLWVYWPALRGGWLWDDGLEIAQNGLLRDPGGWWKPWIDRSSMDYFPLKSTLQWVQWHLWGADLLGYHLTNVGLHALSALLLWRLLLKVDEASSPRTSEERGGTPRLLSPAFFGALVFAVHPVCVESVAWISEFKNTLSLPLLLLAMIFWIRWSELPPTRSFDSEGEKTQTTFPMKRIGGNPLHLRSSNEARSGQHAPPFYLLSLIFFLAAMLSKSSVVMFPFVLLLYAWWKRGRIGRRDLLAAAPFFLVSLALGVATIWFQGHRAIGLAGTPAGFESRLAQAGWSIVLYFRDCIFPLHLAPIYSRWNADWPTPLQFLPWVAIGAVFLLLIRWGGAPPRRPMTSANDETPNADQASQGSVFARGYDATSRAAPPQAAKDAVFGLGWFVLFLLPVLGLVPMAYLRVSPRADHFAYISLVGLVGLCAAGFSNAKKFPLFAFRFPLFRSLLVSMIVLALAIESHRYARIFRSEESLWTYAVQCNPEAWLARNNLGKVFLEAGRPADAAGQFRQAARLEPDSPEVHANWGNALEKSGLVGEARSQYEAALRIDPGFAGAHYNLGLSFLLSGRLAEAADQFRAALRSDPGRAAADNDLGLALFRMGRLPEAIGAYRQALLLSPNLPEARLNLGNAFFQLGRLDDAVDQYREALRENPQYASAHHNLGYALERLGRFPEAKVELDAAERLESGR